MILKIVQLLKIVQILLRNKQLISYGFFGVCTTLINTLAYRILYERIGLENVYATILAWFIAVVFAFITNRKYVFESGDSKGGAFIWQLLSFFGARIATGLLDVVIMYYAVDVYGFNPTLSKLVSNVIVIILNYLLSKFVVFRKSGKVQPALVTREAPAEGAEDEGAEDGNAETAEAQNSAEAPAVEVNVTNASIPASELNVTDASKPAAEEKAE